MDEKYFDLLITEHILLNERADYGAKIYHKLARDTGGSERRRRSVPQ